MPLSDTRAEKIISAISAVLFVCIIIGLVFHLKGKSGTKPMSQTKVSRSGASGLMASITTHKNHKTNEWADQSMDGVGGLDLPKVREAANSYVGVHDSGCAARGFSSTAINGNLYFVAVDLACGKTRKSVNLIARRFYTMDQKSSYWKADLLSKDEVGLALTESQAETSQDQ